MDKHRPAHEQASPAEKRRAPRQRHVSAIEIFNDSGHFITAVGRLLDFSAVGACFSSPTKLSVKEKLQVRLRLLKNTKVEMTARVVWSKRRGSAHVYGIEFERILKD